MVLYSHSSTDNPKGSTVKRTAVMHYIRPLAIGVFVAEAIGAVVLERYDLIPLLGALVFALALQGMDERRADRAEDELEEMRGTQG